MKVEILRRRFLQGNAALSIIGDTSSGMCVYKCAISKILGLLLAILLFFEIWRMLTAIYGGMEDRAATAMHILKSSPFLIGEILLGIVIPFSVILFSSGKA